MPQYLSTDPNAGDWQGPPDETTRLNPREEQAFKAWASSAGIRDVDHPDSRYDYRGYWKDVASKGADQRKQYDDGPHFPDTYKQHGHETFSVESQYSRGDTDGGRWEGEKYLPQWSASRYLSTDPNAGMETSSEPLAGDETPSAGSRFVAGVGRVLDPRPLVGLLKSAVTPRTEGPLKYVPPPLATQMEVFGGLLGAQGEQAQKAIGNLKQGRYSEAAGHGLAAALPIVGPAAANAGERGASGDVAGMVGEGTALVGSLVAPEALGRTAVKGGEKAYQGGLKIPQSIADKAHGGAPAIVRTGLREGIPISPSGLEKVQRLVGEGDDAVQAMLKGTTAHVSPRVAMRELGSTVREFGSQATPLKDLRDIGGVASEFGKVHATGPMSAEAAQAIKTGTYRRLKKDYGQMSTAGKEAQKALARGLKQEIERVAPGVKPINAKVGSLLDLEKVLDRTRIGNRDAIGLTDVIAATHNPAMLPMTFAMKPYAQGQIGRLLNRTGRATNSEAVKAAILALLNQQQQEQE